MINVVELRPENKSLATNQGFMQINSLEAAMACAEIISQSSFCPKGMAGKSGDIVVALQMGQELGLKPMQALQNITVINGRPSLWGDALLAVCRQSPYFEYIKESYLNETNTYVCRIKRKDEPEFVHSFSEDDAKKAGLWGKSGPWTQYPKRMLQMRARSFALRDAFPDLLRGIITQDEANDHPTPKVDYSNITGEVIEGTVVKNDAITEEQLTFLKDLIEKTDSKEVDICGYLKIECLREMTNDKYSGVCSLLKKKLAKKEKVNNLEINKIFQGEGNS